MYSIKRQFYTALGIFSFFVLCGFLSVPINNSAQKNTENYIKGQKVSLEFTLTAVNPLSNLNNGSIGLVINNGKAPYKVLVYSTNMVVKEYQIKQELTISNLAAGEYLVVVSAGDNEYRSKTITLRQE
jgi:ribosomal protein L21E